MPSRHPMTITVKPPPQTPDAGVIEEARARQRRHRGVAGAATIAAAAIAALLLAFAGGGGGSHPASASVPRGGPPAQTARLSSASCLSAKGKALQGAPSRSLLSILGVLRRPATVADALPPAIGSLQGRGLIRDVFVHYIRRTRVVSGSSYYIYPAILAGCGVQKAREGIVDLATHVNLGHGLFGGEGGGGATAAEIAQGRDVGTGSPGSSTSTTITMIVPDGVANVTLHYPAGPASGYTRKISPPFTITTTPINNEVVVKVPRDAGPEAVGGITMIWRAANRHIIKTFNRL